MATKRAQKRYMTLGEYASHRKVSTTAVYKWKREGLVVQGDHTNRIDSWVSDDNLLDAKEIPNPRTPIMTPEELEKEADILTKHMEEQPLDGEDVFPDDDEDDENTDDVDDDEDDDGPTLGEEEAEERAENLEDVDKFLGEATNPKAKKRLTDKEIYIKSRSANELIKATRERIKLQQLLDEVIDRAEVIDKVFKMARRNRDGWLNWPKTVAVEMAAELGIEDDHRKVHDVLLKFVKENLDNVSKIEIDVT